MSKLIGKYVIVRTYSAGVHCGVLAAQDWKEVRLTEARRIYRWTTELGEDLPAKRLSCHELALHGMGDGGAISETVTEIELAERIETIPCTPKAEQQLRTTPPRALQ